MAVTTGVKQHKGPTSEAQRPMFDVSSVQTLLRRYDRQPFLELLAQWVMCSPSDEAVRKLAESRPHVFIGALRNLAGLAGFVENKQLTISGTIDVNSMSDSQLEDKLLELASNLKLAGSVSEADPTSVVDVIFDSASTPEQTHEPVE